MTPFTRPHRWLLLGIVGGAFAMRAWFLSAGVPYAVEIDEPVIIGRALHILQTGNWSPGGFDYPSLVIYLHACIAAARFVWGATQGQWHALENFDIGAVYDAGRFATAIIGTATVWLTYYLGRDLHSRALGLVAAAQLAVLPMHVRESHFALTDVPATALITLTLWLTVRAMRRHTVSSYAWAGCAAGLSAAAKYNGIVVAIAVALAWIVSERTAPDKWKKALAALVAMKVAFLVTVPYAVLDLPAFLNGFGGQLARFSPRSAPPDLAPPWRTYLGLLSQASTLWIPLAILGAMLVLWRRPRGKPLRPWIVTIGFVVAYFYVLSTHVIVFGRYALPLMPGLCLLAAVPLVELGRAVQARIHASRVEALITAIGAVALAGTFLIQSAQWLRDFRRPDTRLIASRWMLATLPKGTRLVAENSGPTNLSAAGFQLLDEPNRVDDGALEAAMKNGLEYVVVSRWSAGALPTDSHVVNDGRVVFSVDPTDARWGPFVRIVKVAR